MSNSHAEFDDMVSTGSGSDRVPSKRAPDKSIRSLPVLTRLTSLGHPQRIDGAQH